MQNGAKCQVTNSVLDFKISGHPNDEAMVYFIKKSPAKDDGRRAENLYVLRNKTRDDSSNCPPSDTSQILARVKKEGQEYSYRVVPSRDTKIVNMALNRDGLFVAWDNSEVVYQSYGIDTYDLNPCHNKRNHSFSSYVAFLLTYKGHVVKVKGERPGDSKLDESTKYSNLREFKEKNRVCEKKGAE